MAGQENLTVPLLPVVHPLIVTEVAVHVPAMEIPGVLDLLQFIINPIKKRVKIPVENFIVFKLKSIFAQRYSN